MSGDKLSVFHRKDNFVDTFTHSLLSFDLLSVSVFDKIGCTSNADVYIVNI